MNVKVIAILVVAFVLSFVGNYFILKSTTTWTEEDIIAEYGEPELEEAPKELELFSDLSGDEPPMTEEEQVSVIDSLQKQTEVKMEAAVDSVVEARTRPMQVAMDSTRQELQNARELAGELGDLLASITAVQDSIDQSRATRLAKMLESMKPDAAATILNGLSSQVAAQLLMNMRQRNAAKILAELPRDRAAAVARHLSRAYWESTI